MSSNPSVITRLVKKPKWRDFVKMYTAWLAESICVRWIVLPTIFS